MTPLVRILTLLFAAALFALLLLGAYLLDTQTDVEAGGAIAVVVAVVLLVLSRGPLRTLAERTARALHRDR